MDRVIENAEAYRRYMLRAYDALYAVASLPLDELAELHGKAESLGPILDPTAYRDHARKFDEDRGVVRALRAILTALPAEHRERVLILGRIRAARIAAGQPLDGSEGDGT